MKYSKLVKIFFVVCLIVTAFTSCSSDVILCEEDMLEFAKKQHGDGLVYSGSAISGNEVITWFTADDENPVSLAIVFSCNIDGSYKLVYDTNRFQNAEACYMLWRNGIVIHVEDTNIKEVMIASSNTERILISEYPFNYYYKDISRKYNVYYYDYNGEIVS